MSSVPDAVKTSNLYLTIEVTRDDGPVEQADITAAVCHIYDALKNDARYGSGDAHDGSEYRFAKGTEPALADNLRLRCEVERLREGLREALVIASQISTGHERHVQPDIVRLRALLPTS